MIKKNKDQLEIKKTGDGSRTLYVPALGESYHSHFGAVNESLHVFVKAGFNFISGKRKHIRLLEIGLGTGLNALLTYFEAEKKNIKVRYTGLEPDPLDPILVSKLDYPGFIGYSGAYCIFDLIHAAKWEILTPISDKLDLVKSCSELENFFPGRQRFDLVYVLVSQNNMGHKEDIFFLLNDCLSFFSSSSISIRATQIIHFYPFSKEHPF